ncbi:MAG: DNA polymerase III subunit delta' [Eubacterium sp.]|nr:DNA polymerase III subunit delta' [Eubacterium sp.]
MREPDEVKGFAGIIGRADVVAHMQNAIRADKISHAYILSGESGSGKRLLSSIFARTLQCEEQGTEPCGRCASCKKALSGNHPDIIYVSHEKAGTVSVDEIRDQVVNDVAIRPYESRYKIYIIDDASKMTPQAQNALLKTLEEPPAYAVILLLADNVDSLLPTILSRCVMLRLAPVSDREIKEFLMYQMHVPDYQAEIEATFAQGNIGKAKLIAENSDFLEMTENAIRQLKRSRVMEIREMVDAIKGLSGEKQNARDYLDIYTMWFRDVLMFKATKEIDSLIFKEEVSAIRQRAGESSYEGIQKILDAIRQADDRLRANVNFDLTMELLYLTMKEN